MYQDLLNNPTTAGNLGISVFPTWNDIAMQFRCFQAIHITRIKLLHEIVSQEQCVIIPFFKKVFQSLDIIIVE